MVNANPLCVIKGSDAWRLGSKANGKAQIDGVAVPTLTRYL